MTITRGLIVGALVTFGASACATKKYVKSEVAEINEKTEALARQMEQTQERAQRNETRLQEVDQQAQAGVAGVRRDAEQAMTRATSAELAAKGKLIYTVTLADDEVKFPFGKAQINGDAKALVDQAIASLKAENKGVYFEIEGHTDNVGPASYNRKLGEERAEAVRDYLHDEHGIALNRIEVISYGASQPVKDNKTRASRAENRRVVIKVLE